MATSISTTLVSCLKSFNQLQEQVEQPEYSREADVSHASWGDELGRLRVWAANIGAHQTGQSSLDFRLRDASHISNQITKLLRDLEQSLHDIFDELSKDATEALKDDVADWPGEESTTELQQLHEEVVNIVDCLYQLSMLIRKPAQHDMLIGSRRSDMAQFEFYDKEHVRNLHPQTEEHLGQRLGRAITRRRKYLSYRERHHRKLEIGIEAAQGIQRTTTGSVMSETIATDLQTPNIDFEDTSSNSGMSQTSYAPSLVDGGRATIPPPPRDSVGGKPFECPYCFYLIEIKTRSSWNRHIFKDIKPYVCTFSDCSMPDRLYDSRREWYLHEITEHHREDLICSLCKDTLKSSKQYESHVARHLEELALFALPRTEMDDAECDDAESDNAESGNAESDKAESDNAESEKTESDNAESDKDSFDAFAEESRAERLTSDKDVDFDSQGEEGEPSLDAPDDTGRMDKHVLPLKLKVRNPFSNKKKEKKQKEKMPHVVVSEREQLQPPPAAVQLGRLNPLSQPYIVPIQPPEHQVIHSSSEDETSSPSEANHERRRRTRSLSPIRRYEAEKEIIRERELRERELRERIIRARLDREKREAQERAIIIARLEQKRERDKQRERVTILERQERQREGDEQRERAIIQERLERQRERDERRQQQERQERRETWRRELLAAEREAIRQQEERNREQARIQQEREEYERHREAEWARQLREERARRRYAERQRRDRASRLIIPPRRREEDLEGQIRVDLRLPPLRRRRPGPEQEEPPASAPEQEYRRLRNRSI